MDRQWKLGVDLHEKDSLLDGITFETVIEVLGCNEPIIDETTARKVVKEMLEEGLRNMDALLDNNVQEIVKRALKSRA